MDNHAFFFFRLYMIEQDSDKSSAWIPREGGGVHAGALRNN